MSGAKALVESRAILAAGAAFALACSSNTDPEPVAVKPIIDPKSGLEYCAADPALRTSEPCVDEKGAVLCLANTGYPGDEVAICEPDPKNGMLLHYGPQNYADQSEIEKYMLGGGSEAEDCVIAHTPNTSDVWVRSYRGRVRPNSHHLIVTTIAGDVPDSSGPAPCPSAEDVATRWLLGSRDFELDGTITGSDPAAEPGEPDYKLAQRIRPNTPVRIDLHYINAKPEPILREGWIYVEYVDPADVEAAVDPISFFKSENLAPAPGPSTITKAACVAPTRRNVSLLSGHFHPYGERLSIWKRDRAGQQKLVYETYEWLEQGHLFYRDKQENPLPDREARMLGGSSGFLTVDEGEALVFECEFDIPYDPRALPARTCSVLGSYYPSDGNVWDCAD